jgi:recombinational DNA repair protein RecR
MAATETIDINIQVKIDQLKAELEKIPGISKKSAEGMAKSYSREYASMEKAAAKAGT